MTEDQPRRRLRIVLISLTGAVLAVGIGLGVGLGTSSSNNRDNPADAARLLRSALSAAAAAGSFHYVSSSTSTSSTSPTVKQVTVGDAGASSGTQDITIGSAQFTVVVLGSTAYFQGDADAASVILGLSTQLANTYAGRWLSLVSGDSPYQSVYAAVTSSQALTDNITFAARSELAPSRIGKTQVIGLRGPMRAVQGQPAKGTAVLYVTASGPHLPVSYTEKGTVGTGSSRSSLNFTITFSSWREPLDVTAPSGPVPFSSLGASGSTPQSPGPTILA